MKFLKLKKFPNDVSKLSNNKQTSNDETLQQNNNEETNNSKKKRFLSNNKLQGLFGSRNISLNKIKLLNKNANN